MHIPFFDKKNEALLEETDKKLLEFLIAEFQTSSLSASKDQTTELGRQNVASIDLGTQIVNSYKESPAKCTRSDVFKLDTVILNLQSTERLVQRADNLRARYSEMVGSKLAEAYHPTPTPTPEQLSDPDAEPKARKLLLADLQQLLYFIHWNYFFTPIREKLRTDIVKMAMWFMIGYTVLWALITYFLMKFTHEFIALCITVVYMGLMGGYISSQRRMQMVPTDGDPLTSFYTLENGRYFLWFAPLLGAVFAVVLALIFRGGLLQGATFPTFSADSMLPKEFKDYSLLFLWSFIAGFAERFVPDALDRLVNQGEEKLKAPPPPTNPTVLNQPAQPRDVNTLDDEHVDGCDVETNTIDVTLDESLPAAEGGVAK